MESFTVHSGRVVPLRASDVDTDQIIPARFCTRSTRTGHAEALFADRRTDPGFVLNDPAYAGADVLVAGPRFGVGSSRESAVWALRDYGFRAIIAPGFGPIFAGNALLNGLPAIVLAEAAVGRLHDLVEAAPAVPLTVDLVASEVRHPAGEQWRFELPAEARERLLAGLDPITATLRYEADIAAYEEARGTSI